MSSHRGGRPAGRKSRARNTAPTNQPASERRVADATRHGASDHAAPDGDAAGRTVCLAFACGQAAGFRPPAAQGDAQAACSSTALARARANISDTFKQLSHLNTVSLCILLFRLNIFGRQRQADALRVCLHRRLVGHCSSASPGLPVLGSCSIFASTT
eukprot:SAG31_NODE_2179_length_6249_cov_15.633984_6_plen_158_part_00